MKLHPARLYVPDNLDLSQFGRFADRVAYLTHTLYCKRFCRKERKRGLDEWEPLRYEYLRNILGDHQCGKTITLCLEHGIVERDGRRNYAVDRYPYHYRIGAAFREQRFRLVDIRSPSVRRNLARQRRAVRNNLPLPYQHVADWLDRLTIEDVPDSALWAAADDKPRRESGEPMDRGDRFEYFQQQVTNVRGQLIGVIRDDQGRFHSVVTNLKSSLRRFLRLDGEPLANIDIKTSQPLFLGLFVKNYLYNPQSHNPKPPTNPPPSNPLPLCSALVDTGFPMHGLENLQAAWDGEPEDLTRYFWQVQYEDLYTFLQREAGLEHLSRKEFKHNRFFAMLYGENKEKNYKERRLYAAMRRNFPTIVRVMREVKGTDDPNAPDDQYKELSKRMQMAESDFMFNKLVTRLMREHPLIPIITIHDSILTFPKHLDTVRRVMEEEFAGLGVSPQLVVDAPECPLMRAV